MLAQRLFQDTPPAATPDQLWQYVEAAWIAVPQGYIQSLSGWKKATIIPIKKPGKKTCFPEDFRPIALTCISCYVLTLHFSMYLAGIEKVHSSGIRIRMFANDIVLWSSGTAIPDLELKPNDFLTALLNCSGAKTSF
ncbi:hypothetical protein TNCV_2188431 [Trichonephila clavipes]|nr:hypothetical protein TNCV_2188431 [Trichonephila clavipes]